MAVMLLGQILLAVDCPRTKFITGDAPLCAVIDSANEGLGWGAFSVAWGKRCMRRGSRRKWGKASCNYCFAMSMFAVSKQICFYSLVSFNFIASNSIHKLRMSYVNAKLRMPAVKNWQNKRVICIIYWKNVNKDEWIDRLLSQGTRGKQCQKMYTVWSHEKLIQHNATRFAEYWVKPITAFSPMCLIDSAPFSQLIHLGQHRQSYSS